MILIQEVSECTEKNLTFSLPAPLSIQSEYLYVKTTVSLLLHGEH